MKTKINMLMILFLLVGLIGMNFTPVKAAAVPCVVTDPANDASTVGTLNYWLADSSCSTITFSGDMSVLGPIQINRDVTIDGETNSVAITDIIGGQPVGHGLVIVGDSLDTFNPTVTLKNLSLTDGGLTDGGSGYGQGYAPIENYSILTLDHVRVQNNFSTSGSIYNIGLLNIADGYFSTTVPNEFAGGFYSNGIFNLGTLNVTRTTFSGNVGTIDNSTYGGKFSPTATITDSTFANSTGDRFQGLISNEGGPNDSGTNLAGTLVVTNSTFSGNTTTIPTENGFVGVIAIRNMGNMTLTNNTFSNNLGSGAFTLLSADQFYLYNNQLFNNVFVEAADPNLCAYNVYYPLLANDSRNNLFTGYCGRTDLATPAGFTLKTPAEINLGTLGDNGGPTQTIPLLAGSAAIDAGNDSVCPATDQRGMTRPQGAHCDAGSYEYGLYISPDTLPHATYATAYTQQLTASGGDGSYTFSGSAPYLPSITVSSTGVLSGTPNSKPGDYSVTVNAHDASGASASQTYTLTIDKVAPTMTLQFYGLNPPPYYYGHSFMVYASLLDPSNSLHVGGTIAFKLDGSLVSGCEATTFIGNQVSCHFTQAIPVGDHTITAEYTPDDYAGQYYLSTSGSLPFEVIAGSWAINGTVFQDKNNNGLKDSGEYSLSGQTVSLLTCGGDIVDTAITDSYGQYEFSAPGGQCLNIRVTLPKGWVQPSGLDDYTLSWPMYLDLGIYNKDGVNITLSSLPDASLGEAYNQTLTADGGTGPYSYSLVSGSLPDGLLLSADGTITGTPAAEGDYSFTVQAEDANGYTGSNYYEIRVQQWMDGIFELTADYSPSALGQAVTFTFSGALPADVTYDYPPIGYVEFKADGTDIPGCEQVILNANLETYQTGDLPATCATSALAAGTHTITASFTAYAGLPFNPATRTLDQVVVSDTTPPTITPNIAGTLGQNGWYTSNVILSWTVSDPESTFNTSGCDPVTISSDQVATTYTCSATSAGGPNSQKVTIGRDATPPAVSVTGVKAGSTYYFGSVPQAGCSTSDTISGVANNATLALTGGDANGMGTVTATCSGAVDVAGNTAAPLSAVYTVQPAADLSITKTDSKDPVKPGASLVYTLTVSNAGPNTAQSITLTDKLDVSTTYGSVSAPKGWTCKYAAQSATVTCTGTGLASGSSAAIKITVMVNKNATIGKNLVNTAQVASTTYDPNTANNTVTQKTMVSK